jgi:hypothetical protein
MAVAEVQIAGAGYEVAKGFKEENVSAFERSKMWRDQGLCWVIPTRGLYPCEVVDAWDRIEWPPNQFRTPRFTMKRMEVGAAYQQLFEIVMDPKRVVEKVVAAPFVFTVEEDNIIPPNAVRDLFASIFTCPDCGAEVGGVGWVCEAGHRGFDAVSGLYWMKVAPPVPMAYGDPKEPGDFRPVSIAAAIREGRTIEVNGIGMGCAIFRKGLFEKLSKPWFQTTDSFTQDLFFCRKAKEEAGARFGVNCAVKVGHIDPSTGVIT